MFISSPMMLWFALEAGDGLGATTTAFMSERFVQSANDCNCNSASGDF